MFVPWLSANGIDSPSRSISRHFEDQFAQVFACEQLQKSVGKSFESFHDMLARLEFARRHPPCHLLNSMGVAVGIVKDQHAFHGGALDQQREIVARALHRTGNVVLRDGAADHDASATRKVCESSLKDVTADVVEVDVDALRASFPQRLAHIFGFVIDSRVKSQVVDEITALVDPARNAYRAATLDFGNLTHNRPYSTGSRRHDYGLARLRLAGFEQAEVGRHARHT